MPKCQASWGYDYYYDLLFSTENKGWVYTLYSYRNELHQGTTSGSGGMKNLTNPSPYQIKYKTTKQNKNNFTDLEIDQGKQQ